MTPVDSQGPCGGIPTRAFFVTVGVSRDRPPIEHLMYSLAFALVATILLVRARPRLHGTTLQLPWAWTLLAFWSLAVADMVSENLASSFLLSASTLCPGMALMGARRPHHRSWQLIVASLWLVIVLPALHSLALPAEMQFTIHIVRQVFLVLLVAIIVLSFLPTRFSLAALGLLGGFVVLFGPLLPWSGVPQAAFTLPLSSGLFLASLVLASLLPRPDHSRREPADRLWLDFRDAFGTLWSLRLAEQVNRASSLKGWGYRLGWYGFQSDQHEDPGPQPTEALHQYIRNIVRRFTSQQWIDQRLGKGDPPA